LKTIVISGAYSSIGKTTIAEELLYGLSNWSALKVTVKKESKCPRGNSCNICNKFEGDFDIVTNRKIINQKGTDTARLKDAGAKKVVWLKATLKGLKTGLKKALARLKDSNGIVIEGTSVLKYIKPDLTIYLNDNTAYLRTVAKEARRKSDIIINVGR